MGWTGAAEPPQPLITPAARARVAIVTRARRLRSFGRSGRIWTRDDTLTAEPSRIDARLADFAVHPLGDDAVLVTYTSYVHREQMDVGRRNSIWVRVGSSWQLRFHQGTPA